LPNWGRMPYARKLYPSAVSDEEWSLVVPYLTFMQEDAAQLDHPLLELFNGLRYVAFCICSDKPPP